MLIFKSRTFNKLKKGENITYSIGKEVIKFPSGWHEVTVGQFLALRKKGSDLSELEVLSILSGKPLEFWFSAECREEDLQKIEHALSWAKTPIDTNSLPLPEYISIGYVKIKADTLNAAIRGGEKFRVPDNLKEYSFGHREMFNKNVMPILESTGDLVEAIPQALAIYFCAVVTGRKFDVKDLPEVEKAILECKFVEAFPVANFFFSKFQKLTS